VHRLITARTSPAARARLATNSAGTAAGSGANSSGKTCGTCNGLGGIHCRTGHQKSPMPSHAAIRKEGHRWPTC